MQGPTMLASPVLPLQPEVAAFNQRFFLDEPGPAALKTMAAWQVCVRTSLVTRRGDMSFQCRNSQPVSIKRLAA